MKLVSSARCMTGEGPIWNPFEQKLYHVNALDKNEIHILDVATGECQIRQLPFGVAAIGFSKEGRMLISCEDGAFYLNADNTREALYDVSKYEILYGNDAKVGPDGRFYIGTISKKRKRMGNEVDGRLYSIDKYGEVKVLLDGLLLSNGMEWSMDEKRFYHTDSDTRIIKEYTFNKENGTIDFTGRFVEIPGVDGFTVGQNDMLYVACWGYSRIAIVDTTDFAVKDYVEVPAKNPASCGFAGRDLEQLIVVTSMLGSDLQEDCNAGYTYGCKLETKGRAPFLFGI